MLKVWKHNLKEKPDKAYSLKNLSILIISTKNIYSTKLHCNSSVIALQFD